MCQMRVGKRSKSFTATAMLGGKVGINVKCGDRPIILEGNLISFRFLLIEPECSPFEISFPFEIFVCLILRLISASTAIVCVMIKAPEESPEIIYSLG